MGHRQSTAHAPPRAAAGVTESFPPMYIARRAAVRYTQREERYARSERGAVYAGSRVRVPNAAVHRRRTRAIGSAAPRQRLVPSTFQLPLTFAVTPPPLPLPLPPPPPPPPPAVRDRKGSRMPRAGEGRAGGGPLRLPSRHEARGTRPSEALEARRGSLETQGTLPSRPRVACSHSTSPTLDRASYSDTRQAYSPSLDRAYDTRVTLERDTRQGLIRGGEHWYATRHPPPCE